MYFHDFHRDYVKELPEPERNRAMSNGLLLASRLNLPETYLKPGPASGFRMVHGLAAAYHDGAASTMEAQYDLETAFMSEGKKRGCERAAGFGKLVDESRRQVSGDLFSNPFHLVSNDVDGEKGAVAMGFSPAVTEPLLRGDLLGAIMVEQAVREMGRLAFETMEDKYTLLVLTPAESLHRPGHDVSLLFFKRAWLERRCFGC